jgi:hypothetical protein
MVLTSDLEAAFKRIWNSLVPTKVSGLVWMVLHDRIPSRQNLVRRQIIAITGDHRCVFCGESMESVSHLFLYCRIITGVWNRIFVWLGLNFMLPHSLSSLLNSFAAVTGFKKVRQGVEMIWCSVIWTVWNHRNRRIFDNGVVDGVALLFDVKVASWKWWMSSGKFPPCLFYEWVADPVLAMSRR